MGKIRLNITHNGSKKITCMGIKNNNRIIYHNSDEHITICLKDEITIDKVIDTSRINMKFKLGEITKCIYSSNYLGDVNLNIKTNVIEVSDNRIYIEYIIMESNDFHSYEVEYEVI